MISVQAESYPNQIRTLRFKVVTIQAHSIRL